MNNLCQMISVMLGVPEKNDGHYWVWPDEKVVCFMHTSDGPGNDSEKIEAFRNMGYTVRIWENDDFSCFEKIDHTFKQLRNDLHLPDATEELDLYESRRRTMVQKLFGVE